MVCPLRFVLLGASAIVALLAVVYTRQASEQTVSLQDRQKKVCYVPCPTFYFYEDGTACQFHRIARPPCDITL
jgi:hypothetical protein